MALRKLICLLLIVFLISGAFALDISVDSPIPQGVDWSFTVDLGSLASVDDAKIYVNGKQALAVFEYSTTKFVDEDNVSSKVLGYSLSVNNITISYSSIGEGIKEIEVTTYLNGSQVDSESENVEFFIPLDSSAKDELQSQIDSLEVSLTNQEAQLKEKEDQINTVKRENEKLLSSITSLQNNLTTLEAEGKTNEELLMVLRDDLNGLLTERNNILNANPLTGLFVFNSSTNGMFFGGVLILLVLIVIGFVIRKKGDSIYSRDAQRDPEFKEEEEAEEDENGKWAYKD